MRGVRLGIVSASALLLLTACSRDSGKSTADKAGTQPYVAFVSNNEQDFWSIAEKGARQAGQDIDAKVEFRKPSPPSAEVQRQVIEDLLDKGVQGIAVSPNDPVNTLEFYRKRVDAKVPLVMVDNDLPDPKARRCYIGTNNYLAGLAVGELVTKAAPDGGKIAIFVGNIDATNARERRQGVLDYLADPKAARAVMGETTPAGAADVKFGAYTLLATKTDGTSPEKCQAQAREILLQYPDVACLVGLWAYNPPALLRATHEAKQAKRPAVVGFDEDYQTLDGIKSGDVFATVVQDPYQFGYQSIKVLAAFARGDDKVLKEHKGIDSEGRIYIPYRVITKDNVDDFYTKLKKLKGS